MDCTLRDGSYAINFLFTAYDTSVICKELEEAGIELIEIGHGVGLNASKCGHGVAEESDEAYLKAAASALKRSKFGVFCIPGIARLTDIDMCAAYGSGFIRIGTNVTEVKSAEPYIARAKKHGLYVYCNFMKSYVAEPNILAQKTLLVQKYGADSVYLVDSAGGMIPSDIERYFLAIQEVTDMPLAFHGHNNLQLAIANSIYAIQMGAETVDVSVQGMGRSAGNAVTEILVVILQKLGYCQDIDVLKLLNIGEQRIKPFLNSRGYNPLDIISGKAQFHSSYMGLIRKYSSKYNLDPRKLILRVSEVDKVNVSLEEVEKIARILHDEAGDDAFSLISDLHKYYGHEQG